MKRFGFLITFIFMLTGCTLSYNLKIPAGFVEFSDKRKCGIWGRAEDNDCFIQAISADGLRLKTKQVKNDPVGDYQLWEKTLRLHFQDFGYQILEEKEILAADKTKGKAFINLHKHLQFDYVYLSAFYPYEKHIYIIEVVGPFQDFEKHKEEIFRSLNSFQP